MFLGRLKGVRSLGGNALYNGGGVPDLREGDCVLRDEFFVNAEPQMQEVGNIRIP